MKTPLISKDRKKELSPKLKQLLLDEHLYNAEAARLLKWPGEYINMMLNPKYHEKAPAKAWKVIDEIVTRGIKISDYAAEHAEDNSLEAAIPDPDKVVNESKILSDAEKAVEKVPAEKPEKKAGKKKSAECKTVQVVLNQAEIKKMNDDIDAIKKDIEQICSKTSEFMETLQERNRFFLQKIEEIETLRSQVSVANKCYETLMDRVDSLDRVVASMISKPKEEPRHSVVIFQRNSYSKS